MILFTPGQPIFSDVNLPVYKGLMDKGTLVAYNPVAENDRLELQITATHILTIFNTSTKCNILSCQVNFTITKEKGELILANYIVQAAQDTLDALRAGLTTIQEIENPVLQIDDISIEDTNPNVFECVRVLNR